MYSRKIAFKIHVFVCCLVLFIFKPPWNNGVINCPSLDNYGYHLHTGYPDTTYATDYIVDAISK